MMRTWGKKIWRKIKLEVETKYEKLCPTCGEEFTGSKGKVYCSDGCRPSEIKKHKDTK